MPQFANCSIGIRLSDTGNTLEEYGTQVMERTVTSWIASETGKEFEIAFRAWNYPCSLQLVIYVDGIELVNRGYDHQRKMGREIVCRGVSMDAETVKPFVFSDLIFPDGDTTVFDHNGTGDVGTIRIEVLQVIFTESRHPKYLVPSLSNDPSSKHSCINGACGVRLGQQQIFRTKKMTSMPYDPSNPGPVAIFRYIYRPQSMLLSQGIIPTYVPRFVEHLDRDSLNRGRDQDVVDLDQELEPVPEPEPIPMPVPMQMPESGIEPGERERMQQQELESPYSPSIRSIQSVQMEPPPLGPGSGLPPGSRSVSGSGPMGSMGVRSPMRGVAAMSPRSDEREERIRRLRRQQEQIEQELRELEEARRLRERRAQIQRQLEELENISSIPGE